MPRLTKRIPTAAAAALTICISLTNSPLITTTNAATTYLPISSPHFGGCTLRDTVAHELDQDLAYCALKPSDCTPTADSNFKYLPPHILRTTTTKCRNPHEVSIGRCTSSLDGNACSAFAESCKISPRFVIADQEGECKVVQTSDTDLLTNYPRCVSQPGLTDVTPSSRCVMGPDDCDSGEAFRITNHLPWIDKCYCYHVSTGMCHLTGVAPITADASFCAVGGYDCPDKYTFMTSAMLLNLNDPPRVCTLCQEESVQGVQLHESVVESGACYAYPGTINFRRCALESTECDAAVGEAFLSSQQVYDMGHVPCRADDFTGGECTSGLDSVSCVNRAESCKFPPKFIAKNSCTLHSDRGTAEGETWFGRCRRSTAKDVIRWCVWGEEECKTGEGEVWYPAELDKDWLDGCNCENVKTGACRHDGEGAGGQGYYCAVSKLGCEDPSSYVSSGDLEAQLGLDCRLCQPRRMPTPNPPVNQPVTPPTDSPVTPPTDSPVRQPTMVQVGQPTRRPVGQPAKQPVKRPSPNTFQQSEKSSENLGLGVPIPVIVTFSVMMCLGIVLFGLGVFQSQKKSSTEAENESIVNGEVTSLS